MGNPISDDMSNENGLSFGLWILNEQSQAKLWANCEAVDELLLKVSHSLLLSIWNILRSCRTFSLEHRSDGGNTLSTSTQLSASATDSRRMKALEPISPGNCTVDIADLDKVMFWIIGIILSK